MTAIRERGNWKLRAADRYAGIPLAFLLGLTRRKAAAPPVEPKVFAFLLTTAIGDTILNCAAITAVRMRYPEARLVAFCSAGNESIVRMIREMDEIIRIPVTEPLRAIGMIRARKDIDVWIDFGPWPRINAIFSHFSRARFKIGFRTPGQFRHYVYDRAVPHSLKVHETENYRALLGPLGIRERAVPRISVEREVKRGNAVAIHVFPGGSRHYLKSWPEAHWLALFEGLHAAGFEIFLTGGPADRPKLEAMAAKSSHPESLRVVAGTYSLSETARLLQSSRVTVSVDTGILHLASAVEANLVALHGPTSPARWGALNANSISLESGLPCSPCVSIGFEKGCGVNHCMQSIKPETVLAAVLRLAGNQVPD